MSRKRVLLGGSFDPVHLGHMQVADFALAQGMDEVVFVPAALSPFKHGRPPAGAIDRWTMLILATIHEAAYSVSRLELDRPPPSFSVDTALVFRRQFPEDGLWWAIGADNLQDLLAWHQIERMIEFCRFLVVPRGDLIGAALDHTILRLPEGLKVAIDILEMPLAPASSTDIRTRIFHGEPVTAFVPPPVAQFIARYGLYREVKATLPDKAH